MEKMTLKSILKSMSFCCLIAAFAGCQSDPRNIKVSAEAPLRVRISQTFVIKAIVENTADKPQKLVALDISRDFLEGVAIKSTKPEFSEAKPVPLDNTVSYEFHMPIPPGGKVEIELLAEGVKKGDFSGTIDYCINTDYSFLSYPVRTIIE